MKQADINKLGKYDIVGELGRGAMGVVYKGFDPGIERDVAIKTVRRDLLQEDDDATMTQIERFKREAKAAGRMTHPNIVSIYEYGEDGMTAYIAMEFINGKSLKEYFEGEERFQIPGIVRIMTEILSALDYSHRNGIVHRDIKPANIMINENGDVKVTDFGIARLESSSLTTAGTVLGTPSYMSPEQFMGQQVDARSDLFSAGAVLYQLLTGEKPFTGSLTTIMHKVLNSHPEPPSALNVQVPRPFDPVVAKAMAKRPDQRFQTAAEFVAAIKAAAEGRSAVPGAADAADGDATMMETGGSGARGADDGATMVFTSDSRPRVAARTAPAEPPAAKKGVPMGLIAAGIGALVVVGGGVGFFLSQDSGSTEVVDEQNRLEEQERLAREAAERDRLAREAAERERQAQEAAERERQAQDAAERERRAQEAAEQERLAQEAAERERLAQEAAAREQEAREAAERERQLVDGIRASLPDVNEALRGVDCSLLSADVTSEGMLQITGVSGDGDATGRVRSIVTIFAPQDRLSIDITTTAEALCAPLQSVRTALGRGDAMSITPVASDGIFHSGQDLVIDIAGPPFAGYFQVDYYTLEGYVVHLFPNPLQRDNRVVADQTIRLGERSDGGRFWTIGPPFGRELIVAIASQQPLFPTLRAEAEQASDYLPELEQALERTGRGGSRDPQAAALFIKTAP